MSTFALILRNGGIAAALILLASLLLQKKYRVRVPHIVGLCALTLYAAAVCAFTGLTPMSGGFSWNIRLSDVNLVPFVGMADIVKTSVQNRDPVYAVMNLCGNVALFIPLGLLAPLLWKRYRRLWKTALLALSASAAIELIQLFLSRGTDVDDLILNVLGAVVGYGLFVLLRRFAKRFSSHCALPKAQWQSVWRFFPYLCLLLPLILSLALGFLDRARYFDGGANALPAVAQQTPAAETPIPVADASAQTPQPADAVPDGPAIGTLTLPSVETLTLMSQLTVPPMTAEASTEDRDALIKLFSGHPLVDAQPACDSDLVIQAGDATLIVHTECGAVTASLPELSGATTLSSSELLALGEILAHYDIAMEGAMPSDAAATVSPDAGA